MAKKAKYVYFFGGGKAEGKASMKALLGGKGANLADMSSLGLPVPPGFTITTEVCDLFYKLGHKYPPSLEAEVTANIQRLEKLTGKTFGHGQPAAGVGAVGRRGLDARHDGHGAEPRPQRRDAAITDRPDGQRAVRMGRLPALHADVRRRGAGPGAS